MTATQTGTESASAAASGASATDHFIHDKSPYDAVRDTPTERVDLLAREVLDAVYDTVRRHKVTYDEFNALKAWLIGVGQDGEWPLFLDVWLEHVVEDVATEHREGNKGSIEGPYYVPGAPEQGSNGSVPMRDDESGTPLTWTGTVTSTDGTPLPGAKVELWHADDDGFYSQFAPNIPEWNLRGSFTADADGAFEIHTIQPAPYQIPTDGSCGKLIAAAGWHAWRPAHLHVKASAPGHELLTAQLYFPGDEHNDDDIASAVKPELILDPEPAADGSGVTVQYGFVLDPVRGLTHVLFHVRMDVRIPRDLDPGTRAEVVARERAYSQELQRAGKWPHLWRIVGEYANVSIFDVDSNDELHDLLSNLPLFPYMAITVTPLAEHPSAISTA